MNIIHIGTAKTIWLFSPLDLNPRGKSLHQEALNQVVERYSFAVFPTLARVIEAGAKNEAAEFAGGRFRSKSGIDVAVSLQMYNDGLIAQTRSNTSDSEDFLADFLGWLPGAFGLPQFNGKIKKKLYVSEIQVTTEYPITLINPKLQKLCAFLGASVPAGNPVKYEISSIASVTDPEEGAPLVNFRFERAANSKFSENKYYSIAPLQTDQHVELLEELESILSA